LFFFSISISISIDEKKKKKKLIGPMATSDEFDIVDEVDGDVERLEDGSYRVCTRAGSIWGDFGKQNPAKNLLVAKRAECFADGAKSVRVRVQLTPKQFGEQAGPVYFVDTLNWYKVVVEGMKNGAPAKIVRAVSVDGQPRVLAKGDAELGEDGFYTLVLTEQEVVDAQLHGNGRLALIAHGGDASQSALFRL
jgi:hypothetical protein